MHFVPHPPDIFVGDYSTGEHLGHGTLTTRDGATYEGNWTDIGNATDITCTNPDGTLEHGKIVDFTFISADTDTMRSTKSSN